MEVAVLEKGEDMEDSGDVKVPVTPERLKVLIALGTSTEPMTAEHLSRLLGLSEDSVLDALDGLIEAGVVEDESLEFFELTDHGQDLMVAIYEGTAAVS